MSDLQTNNQVNVLLEWCASKRLYFDSQIRIALEEDENGRGGIGVYSMEAFIPPNYTLARIPKDSVLSVRSCSLAGYIPFSPYGLEAQLTLSLALYVEILRGTQSRWHGYLQSLPVGIVDLPIFWCLDTDTSKDGREALAWLRGTEASKIINTRSEDGLTTLEEINRFYHDFAEPLLLQHVGVRRSGSNAGASNMPTLNGFYRAFSLVSSRAFLVDTYHGLSMVPIADAFNHVLENHVHLESDYNVCPECGSFQECPHDSDESFKDGGRTASKTKPKNHDDDQDLFYDMVSNTGIPPFSEVFNTYGEELTNAQLLNQYGFILDINDNDRLSWTTEEILRLLLPVDTSETDRKELFGHFHDILTWFKQNDSIFDQSRLVYYDTSADGHFHLNGEGSLSHQLWSIIFIISLYRQHLLLRNVDSRKTLHAVLGYQTTMEASQLGDEDEDTVSHQTTYRDPDPQILNILLDIGQMSMKLCSHRKLNSGKVGSQALDLSNVMDELPASAVRTQLALSVLMSERSILDCCQSGWGDLTNSLTSLSDEV